MSFGDESDIDGLRIATRDSRNVEPVNWGCDGCTKEVMAIGHVGNERSYLTEPILFEILTGVKK